MQVRMALLSCYGFRLVILNVNILVTIDKLGSVTVCFFGIFNQIF